MQETTLTTYNYLVPSSGKTRALSVSGVFSAAPNQISFASYELDNAPFIPQGAFIDNSQGVAPLNIFIKEANYNIVVPSGATEQVQFPAPSGQTHIITGNGAATIVYVDFPVLPSSSNTVTNIAGQPISVTVPATGPAGVPYQAEIIPSSLILAQGSIAAAAATVSIAVPANKFLRKLIITLSDNATLSAAATDLLTVLLNNVNIYQQNLYIPAVVTAGIGGSKIEINFDNVAPNSGAAGTLDVTLAAALATGIVDVNAYFD
ncbi:MAG: hypothetical protein ACYC0J_09585 [Gammaproteobacteria bacterium]